MISLKKRQDGFTIVELLIVIVVIGILAAIVITTYSGIQSKGRNTERTADIASALQPKLEAFYAENGHYPSLANLNDKEGFVKDELKGLDVAALYDPSAPNKQAANPVTNTPGAKVYSYQVTVDGTASCETDNTTCAEYVLTATYEGEVDGSTTIVKNNLN